jgi:signal transduction histidine kinase/ActR/RegA family two-component response regulator
MIGASTRTEELLQELQKSNQTLEGRSKELEEKASLLEQKNREIAKASANLEEKARELSQISKYKSDFLANMSHELRTPLNSLLILAKMLADNQEKVLPDKQVEYAKTIYSSGFDLLTLINEILDLSKIESGKMRLDRRQYPLIEIKNYVERTLAPVARQKNLEFSVRIDKNCPPTITTDVQRLQQIIKNLLANAFKFTHQGHVYFDIYLVTEELQYVLPTLIHAKEVVAFKVADTGIGIAKDKQALIWEAFQQEDSTTSRKYGGTGLGLTISRELAKLLGGEIWLKSQPNVGSIFTLFLPIEIKSPEYQITDPQELIQLKREQFPIETQGDVLPLGPETFSLFNAGPIYHYDLSGKKILLIDDDPRNLFAVTSLLERQGAEVLTADSGQNGIDLLKRKSGIDLVLIDIMMPEMDGYQATQVIRNIPEFASLPIIALTAKAMAEDREKGIQAGCSDFVPKPVENERLLGVIQRWIERKSRE